MNHFRQGDLLLKEIESLPEKLVKVPDGILLRGEVTGHSHRIQGGTLYKDKKGSMFLGVTNKGLLVHEEHKSISLKGGFYAVIRQREYTSADITRVVVD